MSEHAPTFFPAPADFRAWLEAHHETAEHLWVGYYKKATKKPSVTWEETVDEAQPAGYRRQTARWVMGAKRDETRERRLATLVEDSSNGLRIKQFRKA